MQCCICASAYRRFTTNLRKDEDRNMRSNWAVRGLKIALFAALFVTIFGYAVMWLWNWLMPALFGWHLISFWQALGILVLSKILFGGFHGRHGGRMNWRRRMRERFEHMTPEGAGEVSSIHARPMQSL